jgi:hypothetical protein
MATISLDRVPLSLIINLLIEDSSPWPGLCDLPEKGGLFFSYQPWCRILQYGQSKTNGHCTVQIIYPVNSSFSSVNRLSWVF